MNSSVRIAGYPPQMIALAAAAMVSLAGFSFVWPLTAVYVTTVLHKSVTTAGTVLSLEAAAGIVGSFVGGILHDRWGGKRTLLGGFCAALLSSLALAEWRSWAVYLIVFATLNLSIGVVGTAVNAMAAVVWPDGGRKPFNMIYVARNVGVSVGTAIAGVLASVSFSISFFATAVCFGLTSLTIACGLPRPASHFHPSHAKPHAKDAKPSLRRGMMVNLVLLGCAIAFNLIAYIQWQTTVPVYLSALGLSMKAYSWLWTLNGLLVIGLQPLIPFMQRMFSSERGLCVIGQCLLIASSAVLICTQHYLGFLLAMVLVTIGEMIVWPAIPAAAARRAPEGREGMFQGLVNVFNYVGRLIGPILGTAIFQFHGPTTMLAVMAGFYVLALGSIAIALGGTWFTRQTSLELEETA